MGLRVAATPRKVGKPKEFGENPVTRDLSGRPSVGVETASGIVFRLSSVSDKGNPMYSRIAGFALAGALLLGIGLMAAPASASTSGRGPAKLIDTHIVVGFPQHASKTIAAAGVAPSIVQQPKSKTVAAGATVSFTSLGYGYPSPTVQWYQSTNSGGSWTSIPGATSGTYSFTAQSSENGYEFEAVWTDSAGSATTSAATLTVTGGTTSDAPSITSEPQNDTVASGLTASFSATASGNPTPTVQWYQLSSTPGSNWTSIPNATSDTYSFTAQSGENGYEFEATFTNSVNNVMNSVTTTAATLTVTSDAPSITSEPQNDSVASGSTASFSATASGNPTPTVQWYQLSSTPGSNWTSIPNATSDTYSFTAQSGENGYEFEATFTNSVNNVMNSVTTTAATLTVTSPPPTLTSSTNWSGYADPDGTFSSVAATWTVPKVTCQSTGAAYSAEWVGIDGYTSDTVEQDGSEADCSKGTASYDAWFEMYGDNSVNNNYEVELSTSSYPVSYGDVISASVKVSGTTWTLSLVDSSSHGWTFSTNETFSAAQSSAEWIVERPETCNNNKGSCSLTKLANFGTVSISNASLSTTTVSNGPINSAAAQAIEMVSSTGSSVLALPSGLGAGGNSFTDTWKAAS